MATARHHPLFAPLTFEPFEIDYEEFGADTPQREAKRRRIVSNANRYLQGSALFIQTAALRGPFEKGWQNPWAKKKPAHSTARRHRQTTGDPSLPSESADYESNRAPRFKRAAANTNPRQRERQARAEAEHFEQERRKAKAERREQRRQELKKREEKAAELRKDGCGNTAGQPVDLIGASFNTRLTAEALGESRPVAVNTAEEEIARSREYGSREIRTSFTDEWLNRLRSSAKTPERSPVRTSELDKQVDVPEALTTTTRSTKRPGADNNGAIDSSGLNAEFLSERQRSSVPESGHPRKDRRKIAYPSFHGDDAVTEDIAVRNPSAAPSSSFSRPQDLLSLKPRVDGAQERHRPVKKGSNFPKLALAEAGMPSALKVDLNEESLGKNPSSSNQERVDGIQGNIPRTERRRGLDLVPTSAPENVSSRSAPRQHRKHPSGFTPINQRFSSSPAEPSEPVVSTTPAGRPVLGVKAATNNANPAELTSASLHPKNEGTSVMSAGDIRLGNEPPHMLSGDLEGQENDVPNDENKVARLSPLKEVLVRSTGQYVASAVARSRKRRRDHPLHASPTATNSPGFAYRKVSDPTVNAPKLQPTNQVNTGMGTRKKKKARMMTFGSLSSQPVEAAKLETGDPIPQKENQSMIANETEERTDIVVGSQLAKTDERSQARDLSTQAAILFARQEFQHEFRSPLRNVTTASPEKVVGSQQARTSTPPPSPPPAEYTAITPFKAFNKGKPFLTENLPHPEPAPMSTQELFNAATPFAFSTVKKNKNTQKRVSLAASPLKSAGDRGAEIDAGKDDTVAQKGAEDETTVAEVTFGEISTTPPTPKFPGFAPGAGLKPLSLNPTLSSSLKLRNTSFTAVPRTSSQVGSSFSRLAQPPPSSSAPEASRPVRQEYRRALSQGHSQGSPQHQQRSSQHQQAQRQPVLLDDVDLDSAMDAADSFLSTANLGVELKGSAGRSGARRA